MPRGKKIYKCLINILITTVLLKNQVLKNTLFVKPRIKETFKNYLIIHQSLVIVNYLPTYLLFNQIRLSLYLPVNKLFFFFLFKCRGLLGLCYRKLYLPKLNITVISGYRKKCFQLPNITRRKSQTMVTFKRTNLLEKKFKKLLFILPNWKKNILQRQILKIFILKLNMHLKTINTGIQTYLLIVGRKIRLKLVNKFLFLKVKKTHYLTMKVPTFLKIFFRNRFFLNIFSIIKDSLSLFVRILYNTYPPEKYKKLGFKYKNEMIILREKKKTA